MSTFKNKLDLNQATSHLLQSGKEFVRFFSSGTLVVELYKPDVVDRQLPHDRDEVYIIASGSGEFILEGETTSVKKGDFLFVPARKEHKFVRFSVDFSTWVLFYGPEEGEQGEVENLLVQD